MVSPDIEYKLRMLLADGKTVKTRFYAYPSGAFSEALRMMKSGLIIGWCIRECESDWSGDQPVTSVGQIIATSEDWLKLI